MAPEVIEGSEPSFASDIWSLGCLFYEMFAGNVHILICIVALLIINKCAVLACDSIQQLYLAICYMLSPIRPSVRLSVRLSRVIKRFKGITAHTVTVT